MIIGSFVVEEKSVGVATVFTVRYSDEHKKVHYWQFIDEKDTALAFAKEKTKEENRFYKKL